MRHGIALVLASLTVLVACGGKLDGEPSSSAPTGGSGGSGGGPISVPPIDGYCFGKGTRIATPTGGIAIEDLRVGDLVQGFDLLSQRVVTERVIDLFVHERQPLGLLRAASSVLHVTPTHPIYDAVTGSFIPAGSLGDSFESLELASIWSTAPVSIGGFQPLPETQTVYNLTVANVNTYFAEGLLVHNKSRCGYPGDPPDCPCLPDECPQFPNGISGAGGPGGVGGVSGADGNSAGAVNEAGAVGTGEAGAGSVESAAGGAPGAYEAGW